MIRSIILSAKYTPSTCEVNFILPNELSRPDSPQIKDMPDNLERELISIFAQSCKQIEMACQKKDIALLVHVNDKLIIAKDSSLPL